MTFFNRPLQSMFSTSFAAFLRDKLPGMQAILAPPLPVEWVAQVAVEEALGGEVGPVILSITDIVHKHDKIL